VSVSPLPEYPAFSSRTRQERAPELPPGISVEALRPHEDRFHGLLSRLGAIVWEADPHTFETLFVSRQAEDILGHPLQDWRETACFFSEHVHLDDHEQAIARLRRAAREGGDHMLDFRMVTADGGSVRLRMLVHVVRDWQGRARSLHGVMIDMGSDRSWPKGSDLTLSESNRDPSSSPSPRSSGRSVDPLPLRLEERRACENVALVEVNETIRALSSSLSVLLGEVIELELQLDAKPTGLAIARNQLERVIGVLALHARASMLQGGQLVIGTSVRRSVENGSRRLVLSVSDTGVGQDAVRRARVFASLFAPLDTRERRGAGSLAAVEEAVAEVGGTIVVRDEASGGTSYEISFPLGLGASEQVSRGRGHLMLVE